LVIGSSGFSSVASVSSCENRPAFRFMPKANCRESGTGFNRGVAPLNQRAWLAGAVLALSGSAAAAVVTSIVG